MMQWVHVISLSVIVITWAAGWRIGRRCCMACGVREPVETWALACILPTAGLIIATHVVALACMLTGRGLLSPESVSAVFLVLTACSARLVERCFGPSRQSDHERPAADVGVRLNRGARFSETSEPRLNACANLPSRGRCGVVLGHLGSWWIPVLIIIGMYAVFFVDAVTRFPTGWDGLHYHLPVAVGWAREANMNLTNGLLHQSFPENGMIVPFLLIGAGLERLLTVVHLPKAMLLAAVIFGLARSTGVSRRCSVLSACIALSVPMVVFQSFSSYIDLYAAASWLSSLLALTWMARAATEKRRRGLLLMAGLSAGVALGSKTTFLVLVPLLAIVAFAVEWIRPARGPRARRAFRNVAAFACATLACSAFWFVRGTVQAGNPVYPLAVEVAGHRILPGFTSEGLLPPRSLGLRIERWWNYPWREPKRSGTGYSYSTGNAVGAAFAAFVPLGILAGFVMGGRKRVPEPSPEPRAAEHIPFPPPEPQALACANPRTPISRERRSTSNTKKRIAPVAEDRWRLIHATLALSAAVMVVTIFSEMLRFVLPLLLLGVPAAANLIERLMARFQRSTLVVATLSLAVTAAIATLPPARDFMGRVRSGTWSRATMYEIPEIIDALEPGARILNLASPLATYPLLGKRLSNVVIAPTEWKLTVGERFSASDLREHGIDYIYVRHPWPEDWPADLPVEIIYDDSGNPPLATTAPTRIYRVGNGKDADTWLSMRNQAPSRNREAIRGVLP